MEILLIIIIIVAFFSILAFIHSPSVFTVVVRRVSSGRINGNMGNLSYPFNESRRGLCKFRVEYD